jgi:hypothetical protein
MTAVARARLSSNKLNDANRMGKAWSLRRRIVNATVAEHNDPFRELIDRLKHSSCLLSRKSNAVHPTVMI